MHRASLLCITAGVLSGVIGASSAAIADGPRAVVELFTSQGCSSCPPADKLAAELARDPSLIVISLPVDYWDYLGWKDTLASPAYTARQRAYSGMRGDSDVYTPQVVVSGAVQVLGSDKKAIDSAVKSRRAAMSLPVTLTKAGDGKLTVNVPAGSGQGEVWICGIAKAVPVAVGRGENSGRTITYVNVGRKLVKLGDWKGEAASYTIALRDIQADGVDSAAVIVQTGSSAKPGPMLGAAFANLN